MVHGCWELRLARVAPDAPAGQWSIRIGGWAVAADGPPEEQEGPGAALVRGAGGLTSRIIALHGTMHWACKQLTAAYAPHTNAVSSGKLLPAGRP